MACPACSRRRLRLHGRPLRAAGRCAAPLLCRSFCLSADVCAAFDPSFPEVSAKRTEAKLNYGMGICKFTGARGKSGTSDASAELVAYLRRLFADNGVVWQLSEMGKVDQGGGGTVAVFMAERNIDTLDAACPCCPCMPPLRRCPSWTAI